MTVGTARRITLADLGPLPALASSTYGNRNDDLRMTEDLERATQRANPIPKCENHYRTSANRIPATVMTVSRVFPSNGSDNL